MGGGDGKNQRRWEEVPKKPWEVGQKKNHACRPPTPGPSSAASTAPTPRATATARTREAALLRPLHRPRPTRCRGIRRRRPRPPAPSRPSDVAQESVSRIKNARQRRGKGRSYTCHKKGSYLQLPRCIVSFVWRLITIHELR